MLTLFLLVLAFQIENTKFRYSLLAISAVNLVFNMFNHMWVQEIYAAVIAFLLYTLNPCFLFWWQRRNMRENPSSFWLFMKSTYQIAKFNKLLVLFWLGSYALAIGLIIFYTKTTNYTLLGWLLALCITVYVAKKLFYSILPPEWFLHDVNTGYVFLTVFTAWIVSAIMWQKLEDNFILPMLITTAFCGLGIYFLRGNSRYLVAGCAVVLADVVWQIIRYFQSNMIFTPEFVVTEVILVSAIIIGLIWLIKKPSVLPIAYLALFQLFRFSAFTYQIVSRSSTDYLTAPDVTYYILYLVCWMYIAPLIFWFTGVLHRNQKTLY